MDEFNTWLQANGFNPESVSAEQRGALNAAWRASIANDEMARTGVIDRYASESPSLADEIREAAERAAAAGGDIRAVELAALRASRGGTGLSSTLPVSHHPATGGGYGGRSGGSPVDTLACALLLKAGQEDAARAGYGERVVEAVRARKLHRSSMLELTRFAANIDGRDPTDLSPSAMGPPSTGSMPTAITGAANVLLQRTYMNSPQSWRAFAAVKSAADFNQHTLLRPTFLGDLRAVPKSGEVFHGTYGEELTTFQIGQFARMLTIDRKDLVNDAVDAFAEVLPAMAKAASRSLTSTFYTAFLNNASFFSSGNNNVITSGTSALSATGLDLALRKFRTIKDAEGNLLDIPPRILLVPPELEATARALVASMELARDVSSDDQLPTGNPFVNLGLSVVVEPRLSDSAYTGYSATAWYLLAGPSDAVAIVAFLDGRETPVFESWGIGEDPRFLNATWRVRHDYGAALGDPRAGVRAAGA